ncbi:hypothetical protein E2C01_095608 [Portunus trituberculatus]|uniref:Uncharacterized protein n=1 Tax=Portunus trituberculatus TaxID=210409 RepID=A0A5B7JVQ1_PORTR|nr:hypothetical protein [Portunus trituberculatus]
MTLWRTRQILGGQRSFLAEGPLGCDGRRGRVPP